MRYALLFIAMMAFLPRVAAFAEPRALGDGIAQVGAGNYAAAVLTLQPLETDLSQDCVLQYWLGRAYYGLRNYRLAALHLTVAANRDPGNADTCSWHARALRMAGDYAAAEQAYAVYAARFPRDETFLIEYAFTQALAGDVAGAQATVRRLLTVNPSPTNRARITYLRGLFDSFSAHELLEPPLTQRMPNFTLCYTPAEQTSAFIIDEVERARRLISTAMGIDVNGFRVLLFADWESYARYAQVLLPDYRSLHAVAFSSPGLLVLCSPMDWPQGKRDVGTVRNILNHEMAHLAITQRNRGEGLPLWLNEGLACYFGGWGGLETGKLPAKPLTPDALERVFMLGTGTDTSAAYAQAHAMVTVIARQLGVPGVLQMVDLLAAGTPLQVAYPKVSGESWEMFLANWVKRYQAGQQRLERGDTGTNQQAAM